jgi:hypothetical protein
MAPAGHYHPPNAQAKSFITETEDAFANLDMAATASKDLHSKLTTTHAALTCQIASKDCLIDNIQAQLRNTNIYTNTNMDRPTTNNTY